MLNVKKTLTHLLNNLLYRTQRGYYNSATAIAAGSYADYTITFHKAYDNVPTVVATLSADSASTSVENAKLEPFIISTTTSQVKIRVINSSSISRTPAFTWIAVGKIGGGYFLKVFSRLAERWWEYAERKETTHQNASFHNKGRYCQRDTIGKQLLKLEQNDNKSRVSSDWGNWLRPPEHLCVCFTCRAYICLDWFRNNILHDKKHIGRFFKLPFVCRRSLAAGIGTDISERGWCCA